MDGNFEVPKEVNRNGGIILGDGHLVRHFTDLFAQVHRADPAAWPYRTVYEWDQKYNTRAFWLGEYASKAKDHQALVFRDNTDGIGQNEQG